MTADDDPLGLLTAALDQLATLLERVPDDQRHRPTPCPDWDVTELSHHLLTDLAQFTVRAQGGTPDWSGPPRPLPGDPVSAFRAGAGRLLAAWRKAADLSGGDLSGLVELPGLGTVPARFPVDQQTAEFAVHAWDLARATGQSADDLDPAIGAAALAWGRTALRPEYRGAGKAFGPEVTVAETAPVYDRLAGFFGRTP